VLATGVDTGIGVAGAFAVVAGVTWVVAVGNGEELFGVTDATEGADLSDTKVTPPTPRIVSAAITIPIVLCTEEIGSI
jgi:hypothetical protein